MTGGQIAALIFAILLLLPGGCFLWVGIHGQFRGDDTPSLPLLNVAAVILALAVLLFWVAFSRRR
jgi:membrane protein implicated in regulation of membrane protease activity